MSARTEDEKTKIPIKKNERMNGQWTADKEETVV